MESIIREKQRRSDNKNEKSIDDAVTDVGETISGKAWLFISEGINYLYVCINYLYVCIICILTYACH